ncbi:hypothetical protein GBAR_LOCUS3828 [Geodia barretti]|nr:hypothetical protein GBAR_LOCUS3828 [Geodia barretti]
MTIPFHPNIDPSDGTPHCHLLSSVGWSEVVSVPVLLIALQALLFSPEPEHTVNPSAAELLERAPRTYCQMARDCVSASLRVDAGLPPYEEEADVTAAPPLSLPSTPQLPSLQPLSVSFDDYLNLWRGIATSRPLGPHNEDKRVGSAMDRRFRETSSRGTSMQQKINQHHVLIHGQGGKEGDRLPRSSVRQQRMDKLKLTFAEKGEEEENVDQLLHWTKNLDGTVLSTPHSLTTPL